LATVLVKSGDRREEVPVSVVRSEPQADRAGRGTRITVIVVVALIVLLGVVLVTTQLDKWTCNPPGGVWAESSDECIELP
jgi:hypothetical protein